MFFATIKVKRLDENKCLKNGEKRIDKMQKISLLNNFLIFLYNYEKTMLFSNFLFVFFFQECLMVLKKMCQN
jgi:hypothetical protein